MYLKSIEVMGFKSFANKISFQFHNGITAIVGPNGSGKSNVADAVRWVLGEQSAKTLRGGNMQDVIFAGTEFRKAMGYAYVSITLDNEDHALDLDYKEVTVTRRVYRSGESEYLINGSACRLRDIYELFYDTGIGKEGYSIIGQGQIDKILSGKPEDRRELFDEAAGIVKFKKRKQNAKKKLEDEQQNLVRIRDILSELNRQIGPLEAQAENAKIYLRKKEGLKSLDVQLFYSEMKSLKEQLKELESKIRISDSDLEANRKEYEEIRKEYEELEERLTELEAKIREIREDLTSERLKAQQLENQEQILSEQVRTIRANSVQLKERVEENCRETDNRKEQEAIFRNQLITLEDEERNGKEQETSSEEQDRILQEKVQELEREISRQKGEMLDVVDARGALQGKQQRYNTMLEQLQIRSAELNARMLSMKTSEKEAADRISEAVSGKEKAEELLEKVQNAIRTNENELVSLDNQIRENAENLEENQRSYHRENSRLESLRNMTERYDGYGNSIRKVMEQKRYNPGIHGVVADLIQVEKSYETAIEIALGGAIQNIVTDDEQTAKRMIAYLKENRFGRATFLPLTAISGGRGLERRDALSEPGVIGVASSLVKADPVYEQLVQYLLGKTVVVDQIDHAIALANKYRHTLRIVTLEGESLSPGGSMTGGAFRNSSNLLGRRREMEDLTKEVSMLLRKRRIIETSLENLRKTKAEVREKMERNRGVLSDVSVDLNTWILKLEQAEELKKQSSASAARLKVDIREIQEEFATVRSEQGLLNMQMNTSTEQEADLVSNVESLESRLEYLRNRMAKQHARTEQLHLENANRTQQQVFLKENIERVGREILEKARELETLTKALEEGTLEEQAKQLEIETGKEQQMENGENLKKMEKILRTEEETRENILRKQRRFFTRREKTQELITTLERESLRLHNQSEKLGEKQDAQIAYMWDEYELTYGAVSEMNPEIPEDPSELKKAIHQVKNEIKALGNVNVNAIEEYREVSERHAFLSAQYEDLITAETTLLKIIEELDVGMRKQFAEQFALIRKQFDETFRELFGGGQAELEIAPCDDVLDAGILINAQPPGKKLQNMMQMSGGEKALTAIALLFAIQNLHPSPFCLLDEIEAALDESNVGRYAGYLKNLTSNTQFIVITHRRGTMAAADRMYGITMQEKGVSALVSVNFIEESLDD